MKLTTTFFVCVLLIGTLFVGLSKATSYAQLRSIVLEHHNQEWEQREQGIQACRDLEAGKLSAAQDYYTTEVEALKADILSLNETILAKQEIIELELERISQPHLLVGPEVELIDKLINYVSQLDSEKKEDIIALLEAIKEKVLGDDYKEQQYRIKYHKYVAHLQVELDEILSLLDWKKDQKRLALEHHDDLVRAYHDKKDTCNGLEEEKHSWLGDLKEKYDIIISATKPSQLESGRVLGMAQALSDGLVRTFDGLNYTVSEQGSYVLSNAGAGTLRVEGLYRETRNNSVTLTDTIVRYRMIPVAEETIRVDSDLNVFVGGQKVSIPYSAQGVTVSRNIKHSNTIYIDLPFSSSLMVRSYAESPTMDVFLALPRENFYDGTKGLFGTFDDQFNNDLTTPENNIITSTEELSGFLGSWGTSVFSGTSMFDQQVLVLNPLDWYISDEEYAQHYNYARDLYLAYGRTESLVGNGVRSMSVGLSGLVTMDGLYHPTSVAGTYYLARSVTGDMSIETRVQPFAKGSVNTDVAMNINGDIVVLWNNASMTVNDEIVYVPQEGMNLPQGGAITLDTGLFQFSWPNGAVLTISLNDLDSTRFMNFWVFVPHFLFGRIDYGLSASFDANPDNDVEHFGSSSLVDNNETLFPDFYEVPEDWNAPASIDPTHENWASADQACKAENLDGVFLIACIRDMILGENDDFPKQYFSIMDVDHQVNETLVFLQPLVQIPFNSELPQDLLFTAENGAHIDTDKEHLSLVHSNSTAQVSLDTPITSHQISVGFWVKLTNARNGRIVQHIDPERNYPIWYIGIETEYSSPSHIRLTFGSGSSESSMLFPKRRWAHLVVASDGNTVTFFVDRIPIHTETVSIRIPEVSSTSKIVFGEGEFTANIKDFRVYPTAIRPLNVERWYMNQFRTYVKERTAIIEFINELENRLHDVAQERYIRLKAEILERINSTQQSIAVENGILEDLNAYISDRETDLMSYREVIYGIQSNKTSLMAIKETIQRDCIDVETATIDRLNPEIALINQIIDMVKDHKEFRTSNDQEIHQESVTIVDLLEDILERIKSHLTESEQSLEQCQAELADTGAQLQAAEDKHIVYLGKKDNANSRLADAELSANNTRENIQEYNNDLVNANSDLETFEDQHAAWIEYQERLLADARRLLDEDYSQWVDAGSKVPSKASYLTEGDAITALNMFEHFGIDNLWDYVPILGRVRQSNSGLKSSSISTPFTSDFSVSMEPSSWNNIRETAKHVLVVACRDKRCHELESAVLIDMKRANICRDFPQNLNTPSLLHVSDNCEDLSTGVRVGSFGEPTLAQPGFSSAVDRYWGTPSTVEAGRIVILASPVKSELRDLAVFEATSGTALKMNMGPFATVVYPPSDRLAVKVTGQSGYVNHQDTTKPVNLASAPVGTYSIEVTMEQAIPPLTKVFSIERSENGVNSDVLNSGFSSVIHALSESDEPVSFADVEYTLGGSVIHSRTDENGRVAAILLSGTGNIKASKGGSTIINRSVYIPSPSAAGLNLDAVVENKPYNLQTLERPQNSYGAIDHNGQNVLFLADKSGSMGRSRMSVVSSHFVQEQSRLSGKGIKSAYAVWNSGISYYNNLNFVANVGHFNTWARGLRHGGGTRMKNAIVNGVSQFRNMHNQDPSEVVILCDGDTGRLENEWESLYNSHYSGITFHFIAIGTGARHQEMSIMASVSGGTFISV